MKAPTGWLLGLQVNAMLCGMMVVSAFTGHWKLSVALIIIICGITAMLASAYPFTDDDDDGTDTYC